MLAFSKINLHIRNIPYFAHILTILEYLLSWKLHYNVEFQPPPHAILREHRCHAF